MWVDAAPSVLHVVDMSDAALESQQQVRPTDSTPAPSGRFPRSVNWSNPRVAAILETAAQCFSSGGFTTTTLADIGRELGLRKSIVHYYFTSKATLVREVQSYAYGRYLEVMRGVLTGEESGGPGAALSLSSVATPGVFSPEGLTRLFQVLGAEKSLRGLNLELWSEGRRNEELSGRAQEFEEEAQKMISEHLRLTGTAKDVNPDDLATLLLAILDGLSVRSERENSTEKSERAYGAFLKLLRK